MEKPAYKIKNVDRLDPFLMSLTSSDNHWMFISSNGSLTAGREKADHALFPYITDNLIHTSLNTTGPKTKINIYKNNEKINTWSPLSFLPTKHNVQKNLYKDALGDNILYEETNKGWTLKEIPGLCSGCKCETLSYICSKQFKSVYCFVCWFDCDRKFI